MSRTSLSIASICLVALATAHLHADDEAAIRAAIQAYVSAFNRGDASAIGQLWSETGEWINPSGKRIVGRAAIEADMKDYFAEGGAQIEVVDPKIRFLAPTVATEEGNVRVTRRGQLPTDATYIAIHVKANDQWKLDSVRETEIPKEPSNFEHLQELEWMIGTWVDEDEEARIETKCQWTKNRNFMTRSFVLAVDGKIDLEGTQVIGYDAANDQIRSWIFDSAGGFGTSTWTRDGNDWIIKNSQTLQDGSRASSLNIIRYIDDNTCTWESMGREVDGELLPSIEAVQVVRAATDVSAVGGNGESSADWDSLPTSGESHPSTEADH